MDVACRVDCLEFLPFLAILSFQAISMKKQKADKHGKKLCQMLCLPVQHMSGVCRFHAVVHFLKCSFSTVIVFTI